MRGDESFEAMFGRNLWRYIVASLARPPGHELTCSSIATDGHDIVLHLHSRNRTFVGDGAATAKARRVHDELVQAAKGGDRQRAAAALAQTRAPSSSGAVRAPLIAAAYARGVLTGDAVNLHLSFCFVLFWLEFDCSSRNINDFFFFKKKHTHTHIYCVF